MIRQVETRRVQGPRKKKAKKRIPQVRPGQTQGMTRPRGKVPRTKLDGWEKGTVRTACLYVGDNFHQAVTMAAFVLRVSKGIVVERALEKYFRTCRDLDAVQLILFGILEDTRTEEEKQGRGPRPESPKAPQPSEEPEVLDLDEGQDQESPEEQEPPDELEGDEFNVEAEGWEDQD